LVNRDRQIRVLLIDDEDSYRTPVANHLRKKGYIVDTASNAEQGLALLNYAQGKYDIVFVDQELHGQDMDGIRLVGEISESFPDIPVAVVTGWASREKGVESLRSGAYRYISKSAGLLELELLIETAPGSKQRPESERRAKETPSEKTMRVQTTRILAVFANPKGSDPLRLGAEDRVMHESITRSRYRDNVQLDARHATTIHDVRRALLEQQYRIVQFSGHGTQSGLAFEDEVGRIQVVPPDALADLLSAYSPPIECVVLNACYSNAQGRLLRLGVPYTIVTEAAISDSAATEFTRGFYDAIGAGKSIEFAYEEGCRTVRLTNHPSSQVPILLRQ
jgi:DNA-binding response OmpR family regulator